MDPNYVPTFEAAIKNPEQAMSQVLAMVSHPGGNLWANPKSISHRCYLFEVAFVLELTKETIDLPLG